MRIKTTERAGKSMVAAFFALLLIGGLLIAGDYGVSWDERTETEILVSNIQYAAQTLLPKSVVNQKLTPVLNMFNYERVLNSAPSLVQYVERDHGQAVYYPAAAFFFAIYHLKKMNPSLNVEHTLYLARHIYNFIICFSGWICLFLLAKKITGRRLYGLLCVAFAVLSPRFFADSFYNNKDMIAFITCIWMMYAVYRFFERQTLTAAIITGAIGAFAINTRVSLALFPVLAVVYYIAVKLKTKEFGWRSLVYIAAALISVALTYYIITPAAWKDPIGLLKYVLGNAVYFSRWDGFVYYFGNVYHPSVVRLPWHYLPVMIAVTTPVLILILLFIGLYRILKEHRKIIDLQLDSGYGFIVLAAAFSLISLIVPAALKSNVYNGWRHLYYIYSGFLLLAVWGLQLLLSTQIKWVRIASILCLAAQLGCVAVWMISNHPYQYVYYNVLAGSHPEERFELDYWNTSQSRLIKKVLAENEDKKVCIIYSTTYCATIEYADFLLTDDQRSRLKLYNLDSLQGTNPSYLRNNPVYLVINPTTAKKMHWWGWPLYLDADQTVYSSLKPEYEIMVGESSIQQLYRLNEQQVHYLMETHQ
jgi:hypothetical protein